MTRTPSSKAACASGLTFGSDTGAMGLAAVPGAAGLWAQPVATAASPTHTSARVRLLITSHLFHSFERHLRLAGAGREPNFVFLRELVFGEARQRLPDRLRVVVVDADGEGLRV